MNVAPLARGRSAEVYPWGESQVLKLFHSWVPTEAIERAARATRLALKSGLPVPAVGQLVEIEGRTGLVLERLGGISMLDAMRRKLWRAGRYARLLGELQARIHACPAPGFRPLRQALRRKIVAVESLPDALRQAALAALEQLPPGDRLCHGDLHPDNILLTANGPYIIDWIDATRGYPLADAARTTLLFMVGRTPEPSPLGRLEDLARGWLRRAYQERYLRSSGYTLPGLRAWLPVVAVARLREGIPGEEGFLLRLARQLLDLA